jgi:hypothetical protein
MKLTRVSCVLHVCLCGTLGVNHPLWSHSYLGYGFDVVQLRVEALVKQLALTANSSDDPFQPAHLTAAVAAGQRNITSTIAAAAAVGQRAAADDSSGQQAQAPAAEGLDEGGVIDPCLPAGYQSDDGRVGSGVWQQCQQLVEAVIDPAACRPVQETPCPELPDNMPQLTGDQPAFNNRSAAYGLHDLHCSSCVPSRGSASFSGRHTLKARCLPPLPCRR